MKICFFHSSMQAGGIERTIALLANMYVKYGDSVSIIAMNEEKSFYPLLPEVEYYKLNLESNSCGMAQALSNNIERVCAVRNILIDIKPDVLITFSANTELIGYLAKLGLKIKLIGAERANPYQRSSGFWKNNACRIASLCDGFLFQTQGAASYYPVKVRKKALVIQNGLDIEICKKADKPWNERQKICSVGRMDADKGIDDVLRTFSNVSEKFPSIVLDLYGDGPDRSQLEKLAVALGVADKVVFHGRCKNMMEEYSSHKVFLMMSHSEGFPNALLEAMACGCFCVSSNCNFGPSELIKNGENGILVDVGDYQQAAHTIIHYLLDDEKMCKISEAGKAVRDTNSITQVGLDIHEYIKGIINRENRYNGENESWKSSIYRRKK